MPLLAELTLGRGERPNAIDVRLEDRAGFVVLQTVGDFLGKQLHGGRYFALNI